MRIPKAEIHQEKSQLSPVLIKTKTDQALLNHPIQLGKFERTGNEFLQLLESVAQGLGEACEIQLFSGAQQLFPELFSLLFQGFESLLSAQRFQFIC